MVERMKAYHLEDWSVELSRSWDGYTAPECVPKILVGRRVEDDKRIQTSRIVSSEGNVVTTNSGSKVTLGVPNQEYMDWLKSQGIKYDPVNPVKVKSLPED